MSRRGSRSEEYLRTLNPAQLRAVTHDPFTPLQILAGPGSGKTRVLTSRVAYLVEHHGISPENICAVTFTNKAANEMRERLKKLIGPDRTSILVMGTFHAICAKYLRKFGTRIYLPSNFTICDADESKRIVIKLMKLPQHEQALKAVGPLPLPPQDVVTMISKAKCKGQSPQQMIDHASTLSVVAGGPIQLAVGHIYADYAKELKDNNALDFDDLLLFGVELLKKHPAVVNRLEHVLVDEFQDTNSIQYQLMVLLASARKCVSIVGDPDQSIYGWRSAEIENLNKMKMSFPSTAQIFLEQNYRSTGAILAASLAIISQDKARIPKKLFTSHDNGPTPVLYSFLNEYIEVEFMAKEVKRLVAYSGGELTFNDFVILMRYNALSRTIESMFQHEGIPTRILGGQKFFDRIEIKDLLAYLQLVDNPDFAPAFVRAVNTPKRGLGDKSVEQIIQKAKKKGLSPMELAERIVSGSEPDVKPPVKRKVAPFVKVIKTLRESAERGDLPDTLIRDLIQLVEYENHLKTAHDDWETRWENVQELITFAKEANHMEFGASAVPAENGQMGELAPPPKLASQRVAQGSVQKNKKGKQKEMEIIEIDSESDSDLEIERQGAAADIPRPNMTPLRYFLEASMLSTDSQTSEEDKDKPRVTVSTCHAAKGLEWPVVMIPCADSRTFPFYRAEDIDEERRLLYVACTRAQGLLYVTWTVTRMTGGESKERFFSPFVGGVLRENVSLFTSHVPSMSASERKLIFRVLNRREPDSKDVKTLADKFHQKHPNFDEILQSSVPTPILQSSLPVVNTNNPATSSSRTSVAEASSFTRYWEAPELADMSKHDRTTKPIQPAPSTSAQRPHSRESAPLGGFTFVRSGRVLGSVLSLSNAKSLPTSEAKAVSVPSQRSLPNVSTQSVVAPLPAVNSATLTSYSAASTSTLVTRTVVSVEPMNKGRKRLGMRGPLQPYRPPEKKIKPS